ncbi:MAG: glycosyltransferase family 39 protein [Chloroflexi bacterium]|nr:glycosyltransferase family 39 protein [Chloroflexota bacterium]
MGRFICRRLLQALRCNIQAFVLMSAVGLGTLGVFAGVLAHLGILSRWSVYTLLLLCLAISAPGLWGDLHSIVSRLSNLTIGIVLSQSFLWKLVVPLIVGQALFLFLTALLPEHGGDPLSAHLFYSKLFLLAGSWVNMYAQDFHFGIPMGYNLLYVIPLVLSDEVGAKLVQYWAGILSVAGAFLLGKRLFGSPVGLLGAAALINVPLFAWEMQTAYIDLVFTLFGSLAIYSIIVWYQTFDRRWLYTGAMLAGFALNGKLQAIYIIPLLPVAAGIGLFLQRRPLDRSTLVRVVLIPPALALAIGSSWYMHNLIVTGNPLMPFFNGIFRSPYFPPVNAVFDRDTFGVGDTFVSRYLLLPWNLAMFPERFQGYIGATFLLFAPTLFTLRRLPGSALMLMLLASLYGAAMALTVPVSRYLVVILPACSVLVSWGIMEGIGRLKGLRGKIAVAATTAAFVVTYLFNLPTFYDLRHRTYVASSLHPYDLPLDAIGTAEARERYLADRIATYRAQKWASDNLPLGARVVAYWEGRIYYLGANALSADQFTFGQDLFSDQAQVRLRALRDIGASHLLVLDSDAWQRRDKLFRLDSEFANRHLQLLYTRDQTSVFALNYDADQGLEEPFVLRDLVFDKVSFGIPSNVGGEDRVRIEGVNRDDDTRLSMLQRAQAQLDYPIKLPKDKSVELALGVAANNTDGNSAMLARIEIVVDGQADEIYRREIDAGSRKDTDRKWFDERIGLTAYAGRAVVLRFVADVGPSHRDDGVDWVAWSRPLIITERGIP